ncbi:MAG: neutral zinc metallopeptidase [Taibaiella sp.]|nr:neutral zinc metallopeptidase [Taibaiella sp.]
MRWLGGRESSNVEYSRGGGGGKLVGGGIVTLIIAAVVYLMGGNPSALLQQGGGSSATETYQKTDAQMDKTDHFVKVILAETEDVWGHLFTDMGKQYQKPLLVSFDGEVSSACGSATSATGPFYCPADEKVYLDKSFFDELSKRFGAPGDFANAYVIAHEVGHHVQQLMGTTEKFERMREGMSKKEANRLSVMMELQADFYAGIWAHYVAKTENIVEAGDVEAALTAANAIGDDRLQKQTQGTVVPDAFTHGTSQQRMYWFKKGYETGDVAQGNTFKELGGLNYN